VKNVSIWILLWILSVFQCEIKGAEFSSVRQLQDTYLKIAQEMDAAYLSAGTKVDIAGYDLEELERQGKTVNSAIKAKIAETDRRLRSQWQELETRRQAIENEIRLLPEHPMTHELRIENLSEGTAGEEGWFALRKAEIVDSKGSKLLLAPSKFRGGAYQDRYSHQCEPSPCAIVYGKKSRTSIMVAGFDLPEMRVTQGLKLILTGLDHDKPGQTPIRILIDGIVIFEGKNGFKKIGWSEKVYSIPESVWTVSGRKTLQTDDIAVEINAWHESIKNFSKTAMREADAIETLTQSMRKGLVWTKKEYSRDWWNEGFLRGMCLESHTGYIENDKGKQRGMPWFPQNEEYVAKAFASIGVNMIYLYPSTNWGFDVVPHVLAENKKTGTPVLLCRWELPRPVEFDKAKSVSVYFDPKEAIQKTEDHIRSYTRLDDPDRTILRGVTVDEPRILDEPYAGRELAGQGEKIYANPQILSAWRTYLEKRGDLPVASDRMTAIKNLPTVEVKTEDDRVAWMEWQYFKMEFMTDYYAKIYDSLVKKDIFPFFVIQDYLMHEPQVAPFVFYGDKLPIVSTDLYNNARINEAFGMDLLRSVSKGKAILLPGSGYSAKTPARFYRTLANAMLRADGVVQWIYTYASKYRAPYFFVRFALKDDRGREALDNWRPEYWDIQASLYRGMTRAENFLTDTHSTAQIAVLYSMRSVIAESAGGGYWSNTRCRNSLYVYNALVGLHRSFEACMVEGLTQEKLSRYKVLFLIDAPALTPQECELLRRWVRQGGTLIASGNTSLCDLWGRSQPDYGLADIFGLHLDRMDKGVSKFSFQNSDPRMIRVDYDKTFPYAKVRIDKAKILARWENQSPALTVNAVDRGRVYFISALKPGFYSVENDPLSGLYDESCPGFPQLLRQLARRHCDTPIVEITDVPGDVEVQVRRKGDRYIIHLLDWREERTLQGLTLKINQPGKWKMSYPMMRSEKQSVPADHRMELQPLYVHSMIVLEPEEMNRK
jgi:hypothetical protein